MYTRGYNAVPPIPPPTEVTECQCANIRYVHIDSLSPQTRELIASCLRFLQIRKAAQGFLEKYPDLDNPGRQDPDKEIICSDYNGMKRALLAGDQMSDRLNRLLEEIERQVGSQVRECLAQEREIRQAGGFEECGEIYADMVRRGVNLNILTMNAWIEKCTKFNQLRRVLERMLQHNVHPNSQTLRLITSLSPDIKGYLLSFLEKTFESSHPAQGKWGDIVGYLRENLGTRD